MRENSARMVQIGRYLTEFSHIFFSFVKSQFVIKPNVGDTTWWSSLEVDYKLLLSLSLRAHYAKTKSGGIGRFDSWPWKKIVKTVFAFRQKRYNFELTYKKFFYNALCYIFLQLYLRVYNIKRYSRKWTLHCLFI